MGSAMSRDVCVALDGYTWTDIAMTFGLVVDAGLETETDVREAIELGMRFAICTGVVMKMKLAVGTASETDVGVAM